jgi:hypothetical protein
LCFQVRDLLEEDIEADEQKPYKLAKSVYQACMDTATIEAAGLAPLEAVLDRLGGWPLLQGRAWRGEDFTW